MKRKTRIRSSKFRKASCRRMDTRSFSNPWASPARSLPFPRIAIVNSWSEQSPGHSHLRAISEGVKAGIRMAGGMPFEINVIGPCSVLNGGQADMLYDLPQREAILTSIESALHVGWCQGWVGIGSCDKIVPGMLLAALRMDRPFIFIGGGQMLPSDYEGERFGFVKGMEIISQQLDKLQEGKLGSGGIRQAVGRTDRLLRIVGRSLR